MKTAIATLYVVYGDVNDPFFTRKEYTLSATYTWDDVVMAARDHARGISGVISAFVTAPSPMIGRSGERVPITKVFRRNEFTAPTPVLNTCVTGERP
jgi:hypothetical protein